MSKRKNIFPRIILYGVLALLSLTILYPFWYIFVVSIMPYDEYLLATRQAVLLWPKEVTWEAYEFVFTESDFTPLVQGFTSDNYVKFVGDMNTVRDEYFTKFITGELDIDENWQAFLDAFNQAGNDVVTEDVNAFMSEK